MMNRRKFIIGASAALGYLGLAGLENTIWNKNQDIPQNKVPDANNHSINSSQQKLKEDLYGLMESQGFSFVENYNANILSVEVVGASPFESPPPIESYATKDNKIRLKFGEIRGDRNLILKNTVKPPEQVLEDIAKDPKYHKNFDYLVQRFAFDDNGNLLLGMYSIWRTPK